MGQHGVEFSDPMPAGIPDPETLTSARELMQPYADQSPFARYYAEKSPFDIRHVTRTVMLVRIRRARRTTRASRWCGCVWPVRVEAPQIMHRAMLALGCDQIMLEPILRRAGLSLMTPGISYASIDHSMWWYRDIDINQWHLYVQDTPHRRSRPRPGCREGLHAGWFAGGRDAQEAMIRVPEER